MKTVSIVGMGMMGGSLGLALRRKKSYRVIGVGRDSRKLERAQELGACDEISTDASRAAHASDIVVLCVSVSEIVPSVQRIIPSLKPGAVVTDIGSVKAKILEGVRGLSGGNKFSFVGGHPLAGSEKTGVENARGELYEGATTVLCPADSKMPALEEVSALWKEAGASTLVMAPEVHDRLVAQTSHLPHVLAGALTKMISGLIERDANAARLLAGSFRDMTRIADADPAQWAEICGMNQEFLLGAVKSYRDILDSLASDLERQKVGSEAWRKFFAESKAGKERLALLQKSKASH